MQLFKFLTLSLVVITMGLPQAQAKVTTRPKAKLSTKISKPTQSAQSMTVFQKNSLVNAVSSKINAEKSKITSKKNFNERSYDPNSFLGKAVKKCYESAQSLYDAAVAKENACLERENNALDAMSRTQSWDFLDSIGCTGNYATCVANYIMNKCKNETAGDYSKADNKKKSCDTAADTANKACKNIENTRNISKSAYEKLKAAREELEKKLLKAKEDEAKAKEKYDKDQGNYDKMCIEKK